MPHSLPLYSNPPPITPLFLLSQLQLSSLAVLSVSAHIQTSDAEQRGAKHIPPEQVVRAKRAIRTKPVAQATELIQDCRQASSGLYSQREKKGEDVFGVCVWKERGESEGLCDLPELTPPQETA
ncbi:hypothetical protein Baya_15327 [Bagarius yarrelli]|uniref:Uncharacterized protein n=1 Tax=Bagarius yarrelli TaxID=175774 RepID=A0A556VBE9_BAGYA|nr:hypothetical protein Baya_15327 [Bagarius yarrelli]